MDYCGVKKKKECKCNLSFTKCSYSDFKPLRCIDSEYTKIIFMTHYRL